VIEDMKTTMGHLSRRRFVVSICVGAAIGSGSVLAFFGHVRTIADVPVEVVHEAVPLAQGRGVGPHHTPLKDAIVGRGYDDQKADDLDGSAYRGDGSGGAWLPRSHDQRMPPRSGVLIIQI
jgi:hypothetical protein